MKNPPKYGAQNLFPLDAELNLPPNNYSHGLQQRVVEEEEEEEEEAARGSFDEALSGVSRTTGGAVPKRQAEELVVIERQIGRCGCEMVS